MSFNRFIIWARIDTSSAETGSSSTISLGREASAAASATRWRCPPLNSCGYCWACSGRMKKPTPAALEYLAMVTPIHPKAYREKVGPAGFSAKPVGAGPYRIIKNDQGKEVVFERFEEYWAGSPKGKPAIKTLHVR